MKTNWKEDSEKTGIYSIQNLLNNKVYIGKSINIANRIKGHISLLNNGTKGRENRHLVDAWKQYGEENFTYSVIEVINKDQESFKEILKEREVYWIKYYNSIDRRFGYNLTLHYIGKAICHPETIAIHKSKLSSRKGSKCTEEQRKRMSVSARRAFIEGRRIGPTKEEHNKMVAAKLKGWEDYPIKKEGARKNISKGKCNYKYLQYTKEWELVAEWETIWDLQQAYPEFKVTNNIRKVCREEREIAYGFRWKRIKIGK